MYEKKRDRRSTGPSPSSLIVVETGNLMENAAKQCFAYTWKQPCLESGVGVNTCLTVLLKLLKVFCCSPWGFSTFFFFLLGSFSSVDVRVDSRGRGSHSMFVQIKQLCFFIHISCGFAAVFQGKTFHLLLRRSRNTGNKLSSVKVWFSWTHYHTPSDHSTTQYKHLIISVFCQ